MSEAAVEEGRGRTGGTSESCLLSGEDVTVSVLAESCEEELESTTHAGRWHVGGRTHLRLWRARECSAGEEGRLGCWTFCGRGGSKEERSCRCRSLGQSRGVRSSRSVSLAALWNPALFSRENSLYSTGAD